MFLHLPPYIVYIIYTHVCMCVCVCVCVSFPFRYLYTSYSLGTSCYLSATSTCWIRWHWRCWYYQECLMVCDYIVVLTFFRREPNWVANITQAKPEWCTRNSEACWQSNDLGEYSCWSWFGGYWFLNFGIRSLAWRRILRMQNQAKPRSTKASRIFKGLPHDNQIHKKPSHFQMPSLSERQDSTLPETRQHHLKLRTIASRNASYWEWDARLAWWPVLGRLEVAKVGDHRYITYLSFPFHSFTTKIVLETME